MGKKIRLTTFKSSILANAGRIENALAVTKSISKLYLISLSILLTVLFSATLDGTRLYASDNPTTIRKEPAGENVSNTKLRNTKVKRPGFRLEVLCDFLDDATSPQPITPGHIDDMMKKFRDLGVTRVSWGYYADERGGHVVPYDKKGKGKAVRVFTNVHDTYKLLGNPLKVAVEAGHKYGIEVYAYYKPYETGGSLWYPEGSPEAKKHGKLKRLGGQLVWFDPFVLKNPELRIQRKTGDIPADNATAPISTIKLRKKDDSPTRIKKENVQIWVSDDNYKYKKLDVKFDLTEGVEISDREVRTLMRKVVTRKGDKIRTLTLRGLNLTQPYILVTTNIKKGKGDFVNTAIDMMRVYDKNNNELIGIYSNGSGIYNALLINFRNWGLMFDHGYGCKISSLDRSNATGRHGLIAFARGRPKYLDGALCETDPRVQKFWLNCLKAILDTGVDGIDFRIENHSTHTDFPGDYGYNQAVLDKLSDASNPDVKEIAKIRGDAYTEFLRKAKKLIASKNKKMRINFQMDAIRPVMPARRRLAYPANMEFQWKRWIDEGLLDEAIFRFYALGFDEVLGEQTGKEVIQRCKKKNIPVIFNRYVYQGNVVEEFKQIQNDDRFSGFILYEVYNFVAYRSDGTVAITKDYIKKISKLLKR